MNRNVCSFDDMLDKAEATPSIKATRYANKTMFGCLQCCANNAPNQCAAEVVWYAPGTGWAFCDQHFKQIYPETNKS